MTVSAAASNAANQGYQTALANAAANNAKNSHSAASAFSAVASQPDFLTGTATNGGSTLSSGMLSALLGMNSSSPAGMDKPLVSPG